MQRNKYGFSLNILLFVLFLLYIGIIPVYDFTRVYLGMPQLGLNFLIILGLGIWVFLKVFYKSKINSNKMLFLVMFLLVIISLFQIFAFPRVMSYGELNIMNYYTTLVFSWFFFIVGANITNIYQVWNRPRWRKFSYAIFAFVLLIVTLAVINNGAVHTNLIGKLSIIQRGSDASFNYLNFADLFALFTLMLIFWEKRIIVRNLFIFCGLIVLFAVNSRTTFFLYIVILFIFFFNKINILVKLASIILIILLFTGGNMQTIQQYTIDLTSKYEGTSVHRMFRLANLESDSSYIARQRLLQEGKEELRNNWFLGKGYMAEIEVSGKGTYIHNWLSFWYVYGLIPFLLFCVLSITLLVKTYRMWIKTKDNPLTTFVFLYSVLAFLSIIMARSYLYTNIWFCLAAMAVITNRYRVNITYIIKKRNTYLVRRNV